MGLFITESITQKPDIRMSAINEAYFGDDILKDAQKYLSAYRADCMEGGYLKATTPYSNKNCQAFNREMEKIFGFYVFDFNLIEDRYINAFTLPMSYKLGYDLKNKNKCTFDKKKGYRYDPKLEYCCQVNMSLVMFLDKKYTDREIMATILHEVGHNFQQVAYSYEGNLGCLFNSLSDHYIAVFYINYAVDTLLKEVLQNGNYVSLVSVPVNILTDIISNAVKTEKFFFNVERKMARDHPGLTKGLESAVSYSNKLSAVISDAIGSVGYAVNTFALLNPVTLCLNIMINVLGILNPLKLLDLKVGYDDEKFADSFATMYGYGTDLSSTLKKFDRYAYSNTLQKFVQSNALFSSIADFIWAPLKVVASRMDVHPTGKLRTEYNLDFLEKELKQTKDPRMQQQIKKQIAMLKRQIDLYSGEEYDEDMAGIPFTIAFHAVCDELSKNKDASTMLYGKSDMHALTDKKFK